MSNLPNSVLDLAALITPDALKKVKSAVRSAARKDPEFKKEYIKSSSKISSELRKERLIEENPEIVKELERRAADKEKKKLARKANVDKEETRKRELRDARKARQQKEEDDKAEKLRIKIQLFEDANLSEETRLRIKKAEIYPRRHSDGTLMSVKVLVTFADLDGKYKFKDSVLDVPENTSEESFLITAREELISLLIDVENS